MTIQFSTYEKIKAWSVHGLTAMGLPLAFGAYLAVTRNAALFFWLLFATTLVDGIDGYFARRYRVWEVIPEFDGRKLDDLIDFLTYVFLPVIGMWEFGLLPPEKVWWGIFPLFASGYGFSQNKAKTEDAFVGFPSYWNVVVFYLYFLGWGKDVNGIIILLLSLMVFIPVHYIYPSKTPFLQKVTLFVIGVWGITFLLILANFEAEWVPDVIVWTLIAPIYYLIVSLIHTSRVLKIKTTT